MGSVPPAVSMEFITTIRGAPSLLHQGFRYTLNCRTADGQTYWRCQDRSCSGRVVTDTNDQLVTCNDKHSSPQSNWNSCRGGEFMFSTNTNLALIVEAPSLYMDGTFQICPRLFYQVFTLHAFKHGHAAVSTGVLFVSRLKVYTHFV